MNNRICDLAAELLLAQRIRRLRIDPRELTYRVPIRFDTVSHYCERTCQTYSELSGKITGRDGFTLMLKRRRVSCFLILYHKRPSGARLAFTLAHEVGHIYLGHRDDGARHEREANEFAAELLAPRVLLWELRRREGGRLSPEKIRDVFFISREAAAFRPGKLPARREAFSDTELRLLSAYGGLLPSPEEPRLSF